MGCMWATEWAARGLPMGILPCKLGCPLLPYMETVGSSVGSSVCNPLLPNMKKEDSSHTEKNRGAAHFADHGLHVGNGVGCPLAAYGNFAMQIRLPTASKYEKEESSVGSGVGCPWATHGNFAMQIRLPTTSIYGYSGQLSGQSTTFKYENSGQFSGQPTELPTIKFKMEAIFDSHAIHL